MERLAAPVNENNPSRAHFPAFGVIVREGPFARVAGSVFLLSRRSANREISGRRIGMKTGVRTMECTRADPVRADSEFLKNTVNINKFPKMFTDRTIIVKRIISYSCIVYIK